MAIFPYSTLFIMLILNILYASIFFKEKQGLMQHRLESNLSIYMKVTLNILRLQARTTMPSRKQHQGSAIPLPTELHPQLPGSIHHDHSLITENVTSKSQNFLKMGQGHKRYTLIGNIQPPSWRAGADRSVRSANSLCQLFFLKVVSTACPMGLKKRDFII